MKALLCCTALFVTAAAFGQAPPFQCVANAGVPPIVRSEGLTELVGDLTLNCTGGTPTPLGQQVPLANITIFLNTQVTSRLTGNVSGINASEALLLIDYPGSGLTGSSAWTPLGCGPTATCNLVGNGTGVGQYNGTPGHWNIFQGLVTGPNSVTFPVPLDPTGTPAGTTGRQFRITNVRANANGVLPSIIGLISVSPSSFFTINNPQQTLAYVQQGLAFSGKGSTNQFCPSLGLNGNPDAPSNGRTTLTFTENFPTSFKTKTQEAGTTLPPSAGLSPLIGTADSGTTPGIVIYGLQPGIGFLTPLTTNLIDSTGAVGGTATASSPTGTVSGNNLTVIGDSTGSATIDWLIGTRVSSNPQSLPTTLTLTGSPLALSTPANIFMIPGFLNSPKEPFPFSLAFSQGNVMIPSFPFPGDVMPFNATSIQAPPSELWEAWEAAIIVGCVDGGNSLNTISGQALPKFTGALGSTPTTNASAPSIFTLPVVSSGLPTTGVTMTVNPPAPWLNVTMSDTTTPFTAFLNTNPAAKGNYSTTLTFNAPGGLSLAVPVTNTVAPAPWFNIYGFDNQASYVSTVVAPGEPFVIIGGDDFGPSSIAGPTLDSTGRAATTLGNTQVLFDGTLSPLYYSLSNNGKGQVAGFAPFGLAGKTSTNVQVVYNGVTSPPVQIAVTDAMPGLYTADSSGGGQGSILNHDLTVNSPSNPESVGNLAVFYGGGGGQTSPPGRDGALAGIGGPLATFLASVQVFIDGIQATNIPYAGPAPGIVEGVFQINAVIPPGVRRNANVPVVVVINGKQSQPGVTLATK